MRKLFIYNCFQKVLISNSAFVRASVEILQQWELKIVLIYWIILCGFAGCFGFCFCGDDADDSARLNDHSMMRGKFSCRWKISERAGWCIFGIGFNQRWKLPTSPEFLVQDTFIFSSNSLIPIMNEWIIPTRGQFPTMPSETERNGFAVSIPFNRGTKVRNRRNRVEASEWKLQSLHEFSWTEHAYGKSRWSRDSAGSNKQSSFLIFLFRNSKQNVSKRFVGVA